jgi:hypothetical protein
VYVPVGQLDPEFKLIRFWLSIVKTGFELPKKVIVTLAAVKLVAVSQKYMLVTTLAGADVPLSYPSVFK